MESDRNRQQTIRRLKAQLLLIENIRALLYRRNLDAGALAIWCGHKPPWISKIISGGRGVQVKDLGRIADFFGLTVAELFQHGIGEMGERRKAERRAVADRRSSTQKDRRQPIEGRLHPDVQPRFPPRRIYDEDKPAPQRLRLHPAEGRENKAHPPRRPEAT